MTVARHKRRLLCSFGCMLQGCRVAGCAHLPVHDRREDGERRERDGIDENIGGGGAAQNGVHASGDVWVGMGDGKHERAVHPERWKDRGQLTHMKTWTIRRKEGTTVASWKSRAHICICETVTQNVHVGSGKKGRKNSRAIGRTVEGISMQR